MQAGRCAAARVDEIPAVDCAIVANEHAEPIAARDDEDILVTFLIEGEPDIVPRESRRDRFVGEDATRIGPAAENFDTPIRKWETQSAEVVAAQCNPALPRRVFA